MTRSIFIVLTAFILSGPVSGRDPFTKKELSNGLTKRATLKLADRYYAESIFYSAADNYKLYLKRKPQDRYATYWLAMALYQARDYKNSEAAFRSFFAILPSPNDDMTKLEKQRKEYFKLGRLYYGMVLHRNGNYDKAKQELSKFKTEYYNYKIDKAEEATVMKLADLEIRGCDSAATVGKLKIKIKPLPEGINTPYAQSAPFLYDDNTLYYTSLDEKNLVTYTDIKNKKYTSIYKAKRDGKTWDKGSKLLNTINEDKYFTGNGTFNKNRSRFYFTKCLEMDDDRSLCNIFVADVQNGKISGTPMRLPEGINFESKYTSTQPAIRQLDGDKEVVYYATDREGGKGGLDIWYTTRTSKGEYVAPKPLNGINTIGDEVTPYFDDTTKTLYFSSDGLPGLGGFDVFAATVIDDGNALGDPYNIGKPLNSGADELYYSVSKDQSYGYFVSNREGSIPLDGISTASDDIFYWENLHFAVDGEITRKGDTSISMAGARFYLYHKMPDGKLELLSVDSTSTNGKYFFNLSPDKDYVVEADKPGYLPQYDSITTKGLDAEDTLVANMKVAKDGFIVYGKIVEDDSLYYPGILNPSILVYEVNENREYLFREVAAQDSFYVTKLPTNKIFKIKARKDGYFAGNVGVSTINVPSTVDSIRADIKLKKVIVNKSYRLSNILYDFDKATLTPASKLVLDTLYDLMKENPSFVIELSSHTDGKGADPYNLKLSQARAQSCVNYLIEKGIAKKRMIPVGYGMRKPIAPNKNEDGSDNPEGRALNRRTEFKITKI
jgi:outer membrane protein OmpA-like peptidoglycan-associated protein/tetratricopeptide (TPR) repeat protein